MSGRHENYNLLEERWIPVLMANGEHKRVGIKEALAKAGRIRQIAASNPMDRFAIMRFLLALLYWCEGNPPDDLSEIPVDGFPPDWFAKLDENRDCFNLLGEGKRFYQWRRDGDSPLTAIYLIHEASPGDNTQHFSHSEEKGSGLCPACCAMGLLRLPVFATGGGAGKSPGVNAKPPFYMVFLGHSLAATLKLSWRQVSYMGIPAWVKPDTPLPKSGDVPFLLGLTWLSRRVWLGNPGECEASCAICGRRERLIYRSIFKGLGSTKTDEIRIWRDPHAIYEESKKGDITSLHAADVIGSSHAASGQWAKAVAGIIAKRPESPETKVWGVGFSTVQQCKFLEAIESKIPPLHLQGIQPHLEMFEQWQQQGTDMDRKVKKITDGDTPRKSDPKKIARQRSAVAAIRPDIEHRVSARLPELLTEDETAWVDAADEYAPLMKSIAKSLAPGFTAAALRRRDAIAELKPDMKPKAKRNKQTTRKKGGEK
ncbi:type I-E CRISPR-associated protein Cse1/CasA [bacterium]|nr:type I-E CRISPR-associated protein Cse1/CasA [bacterium]